MGFPIKKRTNPANHVDWPNAPCGLDLFSAAIDARLVSDAQPEPSPSPSLGPPQAQATIAASSLTRKASRGDGEESSAAPEAASSQAAAPSGNKRSRPFPAVLRDILSDPAHDSVVSWLPDGRSFAVHDTHAFSSEILPKHFRKVVFRSFARKLNRWGFRSVKKSISGFEATFEHDSFRRDEPELSRGMRCRSNPATAKGSAAISKGQSQAAAAASRAVSAQPAPLQAPSRAVPLQTAPAQAPSRPTVSPTVPVAQVRVPGIAALVAAASAPSGNLHKALPAAPVPPRSQDLTARALWNAWEEEQVARLRDELVLRELQRRSREREILQFLGDLERQRGHGGY